MSATPTITLQSAIGVDVELRIAGAGSRSYAFVIDWHIRLVVALAWMFTALYLAIGSLDFTSSPSPGRSAALMISLPPAIIYFLYHPILEIAMRGRTPGKRMAGVRIVSRTGDIPGAGALLIRNVFRIVDGLPAGYLLGLGVVIFTEQHVRIGDLAAGTLLVHDESDSVKSFAGLRNDNPGNALTPQSADLIHELLDRWSALEDGVRSNIARALILHVDPAATNEALLLQNSTQLRAHLQDLLSGTRSA